MTSGQIDLYGAVEQWDSVRSFLVQAEQEGLVDEEVDWDDWGNDPNSDNATPVDPSFVVPPVPTLSSWLDDCVIAYSPVGDALAIGKGHKAVFFKSECHINTDRMKYQKTFEGLLNEEHGEVITSIACIPLISQKRSSPGAPDWTCFVVGFNRGYVRIYTEDGSLLISQQFHNERVQSFKIRSFVPSRVSLQHDQLEELVVVYRTVLVSVDGFGLFQMLRGCRNNLARVKANVAESLSEPPYLPSKKWGFENNQTIGDCELIGLNTPSTFDHLFTASLLGGFYATPNQNPPTANVFATVGYKPFLAYHHAQENQPQPVLTEMAYAVASKVKSSIMSAATGWLNFGGSTSTSTAVASKPAKEVKAFEVATPMSLRVSLADVRRHGKSILCSPDRRLSVVTDGLGRVTLIDNNTGVAVRMWKGYRDAQSAWLQVDESLSSKGRRDRDPRVALFLVIYAPRRQRLEVFAMEQGSKVGSFEVSNHGKLLTTTFGMMGLSNVKQHKGRNKPVIDCLFMDFEGLLFTLSIPFHLGLCDTGSSKTKDLHLLKALHKLLRDGHYTSEAILEIFVELRTQGMINQGIRVLTQKCAKSEVLQEVLKMYSSKFCEDEEKDLTVVFRIGALLDLYQSLVVAQAVPPAYSSKSDEDATEHKTLLLCLHASEKEMAYLEKMASTELDSILPKTKGVTFEDSDDWNVNEFFGCFTIEYEPNKIKAGTNPGVELNFKNDGIEKLGTLLFCGCLNGTTDLEEWQQLLRNASLEAPTILLLAFTYWCQSAPLLCHNYVGFMEKLYHIIKCLCDVQGYESVISEFNQVSTWWEDIRKEVMSSPLIFPSYTFSIVCRVVSIDLQNLRQTPEKVPMTDSSADEPSTSFESEFENMSLDLLKWNILLKQVEDLSLLSSVLGQKPKLKSPRLPVLTREDDTLTVIKLLDKGKGCIAELVGRWLTTIGIDPRLITASIGSIQKSSEIETNVHQIESGIEAFVVDESSGHVLDLLKTLQGNFSVSLSSSIILSNYCWEYCLEWKDETDTVEYLGAAIDCANSISSPYIRQGMVSMMWTIFVSKKFAAVVNISKTSRAEKLADKPAGFSNHEKKLLFLENCVRFLDLFMESNGVCQGGSSAPEHSTKKNHWSTDANTNASLTDLASLQPLANFDMILLHYQLALCAQFFYTFRIKGTMKPTNLFDTKSSMLLFQSMHNPTPFSHLEVDLALQKVREDFLCRTISGAVRCITEESREAPASVLPNPEFKHVIPSESGVRECESWLNKCLDLGRTWRMELDFIRIAYVVEMYSSGFDSLGEEAIGSVQGRDVLGSKLLHIAGMRTSYIISQSRDHVTDIIASVSTNLSKWLDSLEYTHLRSRMFASISVKNMLTQTLQLIPESSYDYKLAEELMQLTSNL